MVPSSNGSNLPTLQLQTTLKVFFKDSRTFNQNANEERECDYLESRLFLASTSTNENEVSYVLLIKP